MKINYSVCDCFFRPIGGSGWVIKTFSVATALVMLAEDFNAKVSFNTVEEAEEYFKANDPRVEVKYSDFLNGNRAYTSFIIPGRSKYNFLT